MRFPFFTPACGQQAKEHRIEIKFEKQL